MATIVNLLPGDPAPFFRQRTQSNPKFVFDSTAGRYIVLCFFGTAADDAGKAAIKAVGQRPDLFNDDKACFFGVSCDPSDVEQGRIADRVPGYRFFHDFDLTVSRLYGGVDSEAVAGSPSMRFRRFWMVLDPSLHVLQVIPFSADGRDRQAVVNFVANLPDPDLSHGFPVQAPVIFLQNVFEPEFCTRLIEMYQKQGGEESGFMREVDGRTVMVADHAHKRRRDIHIEDQEVIRASQQRIQRRIVPEIKKVHQFEVTRMERYIVACYLAREQGHFRAHRDNTTKGTAHRRFAVSINLNDGFDGGELCFPEYGSRTYKPPPGGAVVFSCSLLHQVSPVTRGERYAFLPFLYDEAAAEIRQANNRFLDKSLGQYTAAQRAAAEAEAEDEAATATS